MSSMPRASGGSPLFRDFVCGRTRHAGRVKERKKTDALLSMMFTWVIGCEKYEKMINKLSEMSDGKAATVPGQGKDSYCVPIFAFFLSPFTSFTLRMLLVRDARHHHRHHT